MEMENIDRQKELDVFMLFLEIVNNFYLKKCGDPFILQQTEIQFGSSFD
jgi:hypothetical protein